MTNFNYALFSGYAVTSITIGGLFHFVLGSTKEAVSLLFYFLVSVSPKRLRRFSSFLLLFSKGANRSLWDLTPLRLWVIAYYQFIYLLILD